MFYRSKKVKIEFTHSATAGHKILLLALSVISTLGEFVFCELPTAAEFKIENEIFQLFVFKTLLSNEAIAIIPGE